MTELIVKIVVNAVALLAAIKILPSNLISFKFGEDWWKLIVVALVFALVNSYIKPIVKGLSMPISLLTLGLIGFVINAAMLLLTALASDALKLNFKLGTFPPTINSDAIVGALIAAVIISIVSAVVTVALSPRKLI